MYKQVISLLLLQASFQALEAYNPERLVKYDTCTSLFSGHGVAPQSNAGVTVELANPALCYQPGSPLKVAISHVKKYGADVEIEGLMLMMKKPNVATNSYGSIQYTGSEALTTADCFGEPNSVLHHSDEVHIHSFSFVWTPPQDLSGDIAITMTIIKGYKESFSNVQKIIPQCTVISGRAGTAATTTTATATIARTRYRIDNSDDSSNDSSDDNIDDSTNDSGKDSSNDSSDEINDENKNDRNKIRDNKTVKRNADPDSEDNSSNDMSDDSDDAVIVKRSVDKGEQKDNDDDTSEHRNGGNGGASKVDQSSFGSEYYMILSCVLPEEGFDGSFEDIICGGRDEMVERNVNEGGSEDSDNDSSGSSVDNESDAKIVKRSLNDSDNDSSSDETSGDNESKTTPMA